MKKFLIIPVLMGILIFSGCGKADEKVVEEVKIQGRKMVEETLEVGKKEVDRIEEKNEGKMVEIQKTESEESESNESLTNKENNEFDDWQTYANEKIMFKYPKGWYIEEEKSTGRIYIKNTNIADLSKVNIPKDFQMFWISKEKTLQPVMSTRSPEYINAPNGLKIKTYKMNSTGGSLLEAYWQSDSGEEYYATNSSGVGDELQNKMIDNLKKVLSTFEETDELGDWKTYKNEKYGFSFKYPKDWYVYEAEDQIKNKCIPDGLGDLGDDNDLIISKEKLDCLMRNGMVLTGDIFLNVDDLDNHGYDDFKELMESDNFLKYNPGTEEIKINGVNFIKHPVLKGSEGPRSNTTRFYGKSSNYNYFIEVKQLDRNGNGNIDPELMKVVNSFVIEK